MVNLLKTGLSAVCATALLTVAALALSPRAEAAVSCGGRYHQVVVGGKLAVLILEQHHIKCRTITRLGRDLLSKPGALPGKGHATHVDGFRCRYVNIQAGGGAARCASGGHWVLFGFE